MHNLVPEAIAALNENIGDTPTIYAGITNSSEKIDEGEETKDEAPGLSLFGIPIPSLPISLR